MYKFKHSDTRPGHFTFYEVQWRTIKSEHIYFSELILWGMIPEQTNAQMNCTLCPNIDSTAPKNTKATH
jgi:hypothetical protein